MRGSSLASLYPRSAYILSLIGGIFIIAYAALEIVEAIRYSAEIESIVPGGTRLLVILGVVAAAVGLGIVLLALRLKSSPGNARTTGIVILVLSMLSFFGGGGLFIGLVLSFIGGLIAMTWRPPAFTQTMYGQPGYDAPIRQPAGPIPWQTSAGTPLPPGAAQRFCGSCGSPNVATAQFCAKCGAAIP